MKQATVKKFHNRCHCVNCYQNGDDKRRNRAVRQMLRRETQKQVTEAAIEA